MATDSAVIDIIVRPGDPFVYVRIRGSVGPLAQTDFDAALQRLAEIASPSAYIDLADVTAPNTPLLVFLARVATRIAPCSTLLCRASASTRRMIHLAGLDAIAVLRDDLPPTWTG
jgi:hypothetical protein